MSDDAFYLRYYVGHKDGNFGGVEYMEVSCEVFSQMRATCPTKLICTFISSFSLTQSDGWHQFELCPNGRLRYANSARYKNAGTIRKEAFVAPGVLDQARRIIDESGIVQVDPSSWPQATDRKQELEIKMGKIHTTFACAEIGSLLDIQKSDDPEGLKNFYCKCAANIDFDCH